ncbi:methylthioribose-1-phosphate isomerase [Sphingomonas changbaiensis NBRC 104936]|uniref:Methylthioribose-1-phosphate isomerase n=1 Tax=Sphingomonas changbaiensis NBRC 104936 TaxID=1219043 RepID=A0A0E9MKC9_9SPHN|nr:S-methyl-5-thioribose-1-phosphate isomerase [Sphingomonas changbaiensis]GAO37958.1 methylthioribose-1-phosphate isomerase [Sphingomonas changbaiensis NBRC 104936]
MNLNGSWVRSIARTERGVRILDQRRLPWDIEWVELASAEMAARAIREMWTRGAPLIGAVAAYGLAMALRNDPLALDPAYAQLLDARPTAVNLRWALDQVRDHVRNLPLDARAAAAFARADAICDEDVALNRAIGEHGLTLLEQLHARNPDRPLNILTHCNPGWLATVDYGTATAPIYLAHDRGVPLHVWVDETRPRNQGALLTAFELAGHGVPHTVVADNAGGLLMQQGEVDLVIVGTDRVTANGDVCNKIGTYLKALAARDNGVPFYVALPYTTIDRSLASGSEVPIEARSGDELAWITGPMQTGELATVKVTGSAVHNPAFDITPARLVTGYITERGVTATI